MATILYLSYDGLLEPLGHSQVFQYLRRLSGRHRIFLVSYEKRADWQELERRERLEGKLREAGIRWFPLRYHARPSDLATAYDVGAGFLLGLYLVLRHRIGIVHARSYVASLPALGIKLLLGTRFIFDMRGFWADERAERAGLPLSSPLYRTAKWFERRFFRRADAVVSLTRAGASTIRRLPYLERSPALAVIPTCTDLETFRLKPPPEGGEFVLGYVGSADTAYLFEPVLSCFALLRQKEERARLLVVSRTPQEYIRSLLEQFAIPQQLVEIKSVPPELVPGEMGRMHAGIFFVKPGFSTCASVPTKLGEFLACGVPCLGNAGVGDLEEILEGEGVGVLLREFTPQAEEAAVQSLLELCGRAGIRERCAAVARRFFSLEEGVGAYHRIYCELSGEEGEHAA